MEEEFTDEFNLVWKTLKPITVTIEPKNEPSKLATTILPKMNTRYEYDIVYLEDESKIEIQDNYTQNWNRVNGEGLGQQDRLHDMGEIVIKHCQNVLEAMKAAAAATKDEDCSENKFKDVKIVCT